MTVRGLNFKSIAFAGIAAAYVMYFVDTWFAGTLGLFGAMPLGKAGEAAWFGNMLTHHFDGILFGIVFALLCYSWLPGSGWLKGLIFGVILWLVISILTFVAGALGAAMFKEMKITAAGVISNLLIHVIYGVVLGVLYVPASESES